MSVFHKHYNSIWNNGFESHSAILNITPYKPEVMVIGTFNPDIPPNLSDFYYGRNYFWPAFKNMFVLRRILLLKRRIPPALKAIPPGFIWNPTLKEIFSMCIDLKLTFADLIHSVNPAGPKVNLINDDNLAALSKAGRVGWNTENIIKYLCENPSIKCVYFTRQPTGIWLREWSKIANHSCLKGRYVTNIYTPSGMGLPGKPRMVKLINHWLTNTEDPKFGRLITSCLPSLISFDQNSNSGQS